MRHSTKLGGTFDIECAEWERFVVGATYSPMEGARTWDSMEDLLGYMRRVGGSWWSWGGGRYDTLAMMQRLHEQHVRMRADLSQSAVSRMSSKGLTLRDGRALVPLPLARAAELAGLAAPRELGWPCECGRRCGGYCAITTTLAPERLRSLRAYVAHDAEVAYRVLAAVMERWTALGMDVHGTIGGTAWNTAKLWAGLPDANGERDHVTGERVGGWFTPHWRTAARGYYGGRVTIGRPRAAVGWHYDIASAYPASLAQVALPLGKPRYAANPKAARHCYAKRRPGVYLARVTVPEDCHIPPLPVRFPDGAVMYVTGEFGGWWTLPELQEAEEVGARIRHLDEVIAWPDGEAVLFAEVIERWYAERARDGRESAWGELWRLLANSLTGKLGQSIDSESVTLNPDKGTVPYCAPGVEASDRAGCTADRCTGRCGAWHQLDGEGRIYAVPAFHVAESSHVHWAAYLTAATRIKLARGMRVVGPDLVYTATDSIWTVATAPSTDIGDALGQWTRKHAFGDWTCRGPNLYAYTKPDGETIYRAGGMPALTATEWADLTERDQEVVSARGVKSLREAAPSGKLFQRSMRTFTNAARNGVYGDRRLDSRNGMTYPLTYGEAKEIRRRREGSTRARRG